MSVKISDTRVEMTQIVLPTHTNNLGTAFGGQIAAWADVCAAVSGQRFARGPVVTASMDSLLFERPVRQGMIVVLYSQVNRVWRTSMEIGVRVEAEELTSPRREHCCTAYFTFVALDASGAPRVAGELDLEGDPNQIRRWEQAEIRRQSRLALRRLIGRS